MREFSSLVRTLLEHLARPSRAFLSDHPALEPMAVDERVHAEELHVVAVLRPELAGQRSRRSRNSNISSPGFRWRAVKRAFVASQRRAAWSREGVSLMDGFSNGAATV